MIKEHVFLVTPLLRVDSQGIFADFLLWPMYVFYCQVVKIKVILLVKKVKLITRVKCCQWGLPELSLLLVLPLTSSVTLGK